ncbi:hypothetical protein ALTER154_80860 [Alteromonas sp. 154]|nr:hypothetical protein ALTER154_80860 [Alteromonas sp. 154]
MGESPTACRLLENLYRTLYYNECITTNAIKNSSEVRYK